MKKIVKKISLMFLIVTIITIGFGNNVAKANTYTMTDVASHNTVTDCWMIINNNVYNLTSFVSTHSGGSAVIIAQCGKDGTAVFNSGPHSATTINAISSLILGTLTTVVNPPAPTPTTTPSPTTTPVLTSVIVTPATPFVMIGGTLQLVVTPKDQGGIIFTGATTTFASNDHTIATVDNTTGLITGISAGTAVITVTSTSGTIVITNTLMVTVTNTVPKPTLTSITIAPIDPSLASGETLQLIVTAKDQNGLKLIKTKTTFASSNHKVAKINNRTGLIRGLSAGNTIITVTSFYKRVIITSNIKVTVTSPTPPPTTTPVLTSVTVTPSTSSVIIAGTVQITTNPKNQNGGAFSGATTTFTSSNPSIANVSASGLVTGVSTGNATITATATSGTVTVTGTATVTVTTVPPTKINQKGEDSKKENDDDKNHENKSATNASKNQNRNNHHEKHDD